MNRLEPSNLRTASEGPNQLLTELHKICFIELHLKVFICLGLLKGKKTGILENGRNDRIHKTTVIIQQHRKHVEVKILNMKDLVGLVAYWDSSNFHSSFWWLG